ncbi:MAG: Uncharacterized protein G01um10147_533 [Microgenomates group bacterium Gr01-1014_7]|nr:MAG: Uncharacterized protein G01um10147_533 [Microgenomates group bacterium Gr01-1014_7]
MKAVLLHGPVISSSRGKLIDIKKKFDPNNVVVFDPSASSGQIMASLQTVPMFSDDRLIIIENPQEDFVLPYTLYSIPYTLILWFDHEIDPKKYPQAEILFFPEGKEISAFPFLDLLASKNEQSSTAYKNAFLELEKLKNAGFDTQYIITMVFYLLRSLIYLPKKAHPYVMQKVAKQRKNFSQGEIISLYRFILDSDFKIKKGLLETGHAEFLLVNLFCH